MSSDSSSTETVERRLEAGELVSYATAPFALPDEDDRAFIAEQEVVGGQKYIYFDPATNRIAGARKQAADREERLASIIRDFAAGVRLWLDTQLPAYAPHIEPDRVTLRTVEEAIRSIRLSARNDLLHIDNFPTRPSNGRRILRVFANVDVEDRVWCTSDRYPDLLARFGRKNPVPRLSHDEWLAIPTGWRRLLHGDLQPRSHYDSFQLKLHHYLKADEKFQDSASKRFWHFAPGSAWLLFSDGLSYAELRGRFALEHSFFIPETVLVRPECSPLATLVHFANSGLSRKAG